FLTFRLAAALRRARCPVIRPALLPVARYGVGRHAQHVPMKETVAREVEGIDLDLRLLSRMNEPDVAVGEHGLDLELTLARNLDCERLRRRYHAAYGVNIAVLHVSVDWRIHMSK